MTAASSTAFVLVIFGLDLLVLPDSAAGWALLGAMPVVYLVAMLAFFTAVPMIGPMRASMINNMEPITTILLAALIIGEALGPLQLAGAALVIGAIFVMQLATRRAARAMRRAENREGSA
jgi:drug/metabolite transporter (DMT)-like permease